MIDLKQQACILYNEITQDNKEWFSPIANHGIFNQAYMKFINRNLNYFDFGNMVAQTTEPTEYNPGLIKTLEFCQSLRKEFLENGPFGRMCVWKIPSGMNILPHLDNFEYHKHITRYIFSISEHSDLVKVLISGKYISIEQGTLFKFYPGVQLHSFHNQSTTDWYFLGFDFWRPNLLELAYKRTDIGSVISNAERYATFGCGVEKYQSEH